jgi:hypothetical protein
LFRGFFKIKYRDLRHPFANGINILLFLITLGVAGVNFTYGLGPVVSELMSSITQPLERLLFPNPYESFSENPFGGLLVMIMAICLGVLNFGINFFGIMFCGIFLSIKILQPLDNFLTRNWGKE